MTRECFTQNIKALAERWPKKEQWPLSSQELFDIVRILTDLQFDSLMEHALKYNHDTAPTKALWESWAHAESYKVPKAEKIDPEADKEELAGPRFSVQKVDGVMAKEWKDTQPFKLELKYDPSFPDGSALEKFKAEHGVKSLVEILEKKKPT